MSFALADRKTGGVTHHVAEVAKRLLLYLFGGKD